MLTWARIRPLSVARRRVGQCCGTSGSLAPATTPKRRNMLRTADTICRTDALSMRPFGPISIVNGNSQSVQTAPERERSSPDFRYRSSGYSQNHRNPLPSARERMRSSSAARRFPFFATGRSRIAYGMAWPESECKSNKTSGRFDSTSDQIRDANCWHYRHGLLKCSIKIATIARYMSYATHCTIRIRARIIVTEPQMR